MHNFLSSYPRKFWLHLTQKKEPVNKLKIHEKDVTDPTCIATAYNDYFSSIFLRSADNNIDFSNATMYELPELLITEEGIFSALLSLDIRKSSGPDEIPDAFLFRYAEWCAKYLYIIFSESLQKGEVPSDWKIGKIIPIHKSGDKLTVTNYRPVSLLHTASKVLEHFLFKHLSSFLEGNNFFLNSQHGFRHGL